MTLLCITLGLIWCFPSLSTVTCVTQGSSSTFSFSFFLIFVVHQDLLILFVISPVHLIICSSTSFSLDKDNSAISPQQLQFGYPYPFLIALNIFPPLKPCNTECFSPDGKQSKANKQKTVAPVVLGTQVHGLILLTALAASSKPAVTVYSPILIIDSTLSSCKYWFKILLFQRRFLYILSPYYTLSE